MPAVHYFFSRAFRATLRYPEAAFGRRSLSRFGRRSQEIKENKDKTRESGQALAGCSLQGHRFFRVTTTCPRLGRAVELEMRRDGQMEMWRGSKAGGQAFGPGPDHVLAGLSGEEGPGTDGEALDGYRM